MQDKRLHEIRDPIHAFIRFSSAERKVINSRPLQRLGSIHQLALTYLVYPGATHKRFEHSLGVMELADRVYGVITSKENLLNDSVRSVMPHDALGHEYWREVLRMAALCHDVGHLPFSHAAEKELLPGGWDHERFTLEIILGEELRPIWRELHLEAEDVAKLAVGPRHYTKGYLFSEWESIMSEIIVGDAFGVDRMDYLLRDSLHTGVAYGKFDHFRLIDTLRILPKGGESTEPMLGVEHGGLQAAEGLLIARYFMYSQLYIHHVRRIYDIHLREFLQKWLPGGRFSIRADELLATTDNEVLTAIGRVAADTSHPAHDPAERILHRRHYKRLYEQNPTDQSVTLRAVDAMFDALTESFGKDAVRRDTYSPKSASYDFPVLTRDGNVVSSILLSRALQNLPAYQADCVFIDPDRFSEARDWCTQEKQRILTDQKKEDESHGEA